MNRAAIATAFLTCSLSLASQSAPKTQTTTLYHAPSLVAGACPVSMQANQGVWDHTIRVREGDKERVIQPFGQKISVTLKDSHPARIREATVRVDGLTGKNQILQTESKTLNSDGIRKLTVKFISQDDGSVTTDLWLPGLTSVTSVELLDVSYADGSTWKIADTSVCRVQPNPLMLITER